MRWEELTAPRFAAAVSAVGGVCIIPAGVVEKHGEHLPLGTDYLSARLLAERAAEIEPAIVFPPYYFGQILEAKHQPGTIAIGTNLMLDLLANVCNEIARNGLKKIILLNGHGGNCASFGHFVRASLEHAGDYTLYLVDLEHYYPPANDPGWNAIKQTTVDAHAGEGETSLMLAAFPELVRMGEIGGDGQPRRRLAHLNGLTTGISWYANYPDHYAGDAALATTEKGKYLLDYMVKRVAGHIANVKHDTVTSTLEKEFRKRAQTPTG